MTDVLPQPEFPSVGSAAALGLTVTLDLAGGIIRFEWARPGGSALVARGALCPTEMAGFSHFALDWTLEVGGGRERDFCNAWPASTRALLTRIRKRFPVARDGPQVGVLTDTQLGPARAGRFHPLQIPPGREPWKWLGVGVLQFARLLDSDLAASAAPPARGRLALRFLAGALLGVPPPRPDRVDTAPAGQSLLGLRVTLDHVKGLTEFLWSHPQTHQQIAVGRVYCTGPDKMAWELETGTGSELVNTSCAGEQVRATLGAWLKRFPTLRNGVTAFWLKPQPGRAPPLLVPEPPFGPEESPYPWIEDNLMAMADTTRLRFSPLGRMLDELPPGSLTDLERYQRRSLRKEQKREAEEARRRENMARLAEERRRREQRQAEEQRAAEVKKKVAEAQRGSALIRHSPAATGNRKSPARPPLPPVPVHVELPALEFQETAFALPDLQGWLLRERAALWWVSNQSDDLLCLPHCRIERLEYQLRTALRVLGPLRGRALLSDEVGLGKTIEAGLVLKELLTRGMVKRFLVLTVPSLVDQWEEELSDKFGLQTVTTNHAAARGDPTAFWRDNPGIVASLHTLKQPAQLEVARQIHWDILIVDEAHYLRNRESQAWQAVSALPRQFLLLLTATPVQNSLEELYNLVTLLQPGQLLSPKEFRARFIDPKRPRQPREPEELRRLLGQVMIRNTRANSGVQLPPRRAETVLFTPDVAEQAFWQQWETEFRAQLAQLNASQANLWGRLLLQAAGSSPAAWRAALEKFPARAAARAWQEQSPLEGSWRKKCELLLPLTRGEGGAVIFTQFLETQAALAQSLRDAGIEVFVINGATPPPQRQPLTEEFRRRGGALLLTHSGTEGRNLQFCHRLANFDLPWNPMEIEQRIGRLHRLGQKHPVRIYNFVQAGTLQEHLLQILQEKLNLFELVVGETGLVLGDRFSSDEFAEEVLRRWRDSEGRVAEALSGLGDELAAARAAYGEVKQLDATLFAKDYESL